MALSRIQCSGLFITLIFFCSFLIPRASADFSCSDKDAATLLKIKSYFADSLAVTSWNKSTNCCTWENVGCNGDGTIIYFNIVNSNYSGPLPAEIGDLPALIDIYFKDNIHLSGPIPSFFANLTALKSIHVVNSSLAGSIPQFLCDLPVLYDLELTANRLTGSIPGCLGAKFASISLGQNLLSGTIPASIFKGKTIFTGLILLDLHDNQLTGEIPKSLKHITFDTIDLSGNRFTGDASFLFGTLRTTKYMDLSRNGLEFDLSSVKFPHNLRLLNISHNRIAGRIAKQITKLFALSTLDVSYNQLCGPIPSGGSMDHLYASAFDHNKCLCGFPLPPCNGTGRVK